jgi:hypothetical protein
MCSEKQVEANRKNCLKSTGPNTWQGKAVVSQNAIKHGILSARVTIDEEDRQKFLEFANRLNTEFRPTDSIQEFLVDRIISCAWRLQRLIHIESLLLQKVTRSDWNSAIANYGEIFFGDDGQSMSTLSRYEKSIENSLYRSLILLKDLQRIRIVPIELPVTIDL